MFYRRFFLWLVFVQIRENEYSYKHFDAKAQPQTVIMNEGPVACLLTLGACFLGGVSQHALHPGLW